MSTYADNRQRTAEYLDRFDREKVLRHLVADARPVVFDVGANVGATLDEFKKWWPSAQVHCFEPQYECWPALMERGERHPGTVWVNKAAAGNRASDAAPFYTHAISSGISGFNRINLRSSDSIQLQRVSEAGAEARQNYVESLNHERAVRVVRLDSYMQAAGIARVNLLKIDTQGFEPEVLEGCGARLQDVDVVVSELMFYDYYERSLSFSDIERWLLPAGFRLFDISHIAKNPMNGRTDWIDVIYVNTRARAHG